MCVLQRGMNWDPFGILDMCVCARACVYSSHPFVCGSSPSLSSCRFSVGNVENLGKPEWDSQRRPLEHGHSLIP